MRLPHIINMLTALGFVASGVFICLWFKNFNNYSPYDIRMHIPFLISLGLFLGAQILSVNNIIKCELGDYLNDK